MQRFVERGGVTARLVIEEFRSARLRLYPYLVWKTATYPDQPDNMELMEDFLGVKDLGEYMPPEYRDLKPGPLSRLIGLTDGRIDVFDIMNCRSCYVPQYSNTLQL